MGVTLAHFQLVGIIPVLRDKLKSLDNSQNLHTYLFDDVQSAILK
jgi:hypothetical protein